MPNLLTTKDRRHETRLKMVLSRAAQLTRMGETCVMLHGRPLVRPEVRGEGWLWQEREGTRVLACTDRVKLPDLQADSDPTATCLHVGTFDPFENAPLVQHYHQTPKGVDRGLGIVDDGHLWTTVLGQNTFL